VSNSENLERTLNHSVEKPFQIAILPYRGADFARRYGYTVRDLMILSALQDSVYVSSILWLQRPKVVTEWLNRATLIEHDKLSSPRKIDLNILGQILFRRGWTATSMHTHDRALREWSISTGGVLIDFHPFYIPPKDVLKQSNVFYWYDLIDNFSKHNLFSEFQKGLVKKKYDFVREHAKFVSGVSELAVEAAGGGLVIQNRLSGKNNKTEKRFLSPRYDFGFTGFITDKFDVAFINRLSRLGYSVLVRGQAYNNQVLRELESIKNVTLGPAYHHDKQAEIIEQFSVGLVPYKPTKSHDESPIKLWQYLAQGASVLLSMKFGSHEERYSRSIGYYSLMSDTEIREFLIRSRSEQVRRICRNMILDDPDMWWEDAVDSILRKIAADWR